jgi:phosphoenolpyruvate synthase/pyruvate phosphate dikinase
LRRSDSEPAGAKAAGLGELIGAGFPVPAGFGVTCAAFATHLEQDGLLQRIRERLAGLSPHDTLGIGARGRLRAPGGFDVAPGWP